MEKKTGLNEYLALPRIMTLTYNFGGHSDTRN